MEMAEFSGSTSAFFSATDNAGFLRAAHEPEETSGYAKHYFFHPVQLHFELTNLLVK
jgi:hypothetical protein